MNTIWNHSVLIGFISSIFSSIFFYIMLYALKPRLKISPQIACATIGLNGTQATVYLIKVINKAWLYRVLDVKCELVLLENVNTAGGVNVRSKPVKLIRDQMWFIKSRYWNGDRHAPYASIFGTTDDLDRVWSDQDKSLQFRIMCRHSLSGFSKVFDMTYYHKNGTIQKGVFEFGDSFRIV